jgi:hypothetical protein
VTGISTRSRVLRRVVFGVCTSIGGEIDRISLAIVADSFAEGTVTKVTGGGAE